MAWSDFTMNKVSGYVIDYLRLGLAPFSLLSRGYSDDALDVSDTVDVGVIPVTGSTIRTKARGSAYTVDDNQPTKATITIAGSKYASHSVTGEDMKRYAKMPDANTKLAQQVARDLVVDIYDSFFTQVYTDVDPTVAGNQEWSDAGGNFGKAAVRGIYTTKAQRAGWGSGVMTGLLLNPVLYGELLDDETLINHNTLTERNRDALEGAMVKQLYGFNIANVDYVPTGPVGDKVAGLHVLPDAIGVAFAPKACAGKPGEGDLVDYQIYDDPTTGMKITYRELYDGSVDRRAYIWECVYGFKVLNAAGVKVLRDTDLT